MSVRQYSISSPPGEGVTDVTRTGSVTAQDMPQLAQVKTTVVEDAAKATQDERSMTLMQGLKLYPKAVAWSMAISTCIVMEGFDLVLINSLYALPAFKQRFGEPLANGDYEITAAWQSGLSNGALVGEIIGLMFVGYAAERFGYRKTMIAGLAGLACFIFLLFFAVNLSMLLAGEILCGLAWGAFQTMTTTYAAEVCPVALRAYLTTYVNLCWVIGQFLSSGVLKGVSGKTGSIAYKLPYGLQWIWPVPLIIVLALAPESPWWLVRKGRTEDAKHNLLRLTSRNQPGFNPDETIGMMVYTTELEKANTKGAKYIDCFRGVNLRRTEIVCMVWAIQSLCGGSTFIGYSTYFFEQAGLSVDDSFSLSLGLYALGAVGTISSWFMMTRFGRRTLYIWGMVGMTITLLICGFLGIPQGNKGAEWGISVMILLYTFVYDASVGPVCYSLVAELPSTRLRNKTVVLARNFYNISGIVANVLSTHMLNPGEWNWGAKTAFFWAASCALCIVWAFFRLPEPKGRTYAELDILFETKVSARKFKTTLVESFAAATTHSSAEDLVEKSVAMKVEKV